MAPAFEYSPAIERLNAALVPHAIEGKAAAAAAYMKTEQPFIGVPVPMVRRIARELARDTPGTADLLELATEIWEGATHREHWYAVQEICASAPCRGKLEFLPLYERMIITGAWWDIVDGLSRHFGLLLRAHPEPMSTLLREWSTDPFMWKRRMSMIAQLHLGPATDTELLDEVLRANLEDPEFFIRKAMGWALRQYAKTDPDWVRGWIAEQHAVMSQLALREALKHLGPLPQPPSQD
ncbi:MAG: DNA alkylation repair protein [Paeniglutamicibacter terrestris]